MHYRDPSGQSTRCAACGLWFSDVGVYRVHLFSHHPEKSKQDLTVEEALAQCTDDGDDDGNGNGGSQGEMRFQCPQCRCQFDKWLDLVSHVLVHGTTTLGESNNDGDEEEEGEQREEQEGGLNAGPSKPHKCELCYKAFATEERLEVG